MTRRKSLCEKQRDLFHFYHKTCDIASMYSFFCHEIKKSVVKIQVLM